MNTKIDYNLIKEMDLEANDLMAWLEINIIDSIAHYNGRMLRLIGDREQTVQVSVTLEKFDKWSASVEYVFDLKNKNEYINFVDFIKGNI